ncbi:HEPN domain-containing protein [Streptomyces sp. ID01-9D]|uniref:ApeA N-terminal domain 1-containing protein n=1 Tax=Streptomyces sp. ID01-9D TaxID=3028659 RepID=UPI0029C33AE1|nr:HEPN domain-containing protein [Streptomyces sp. ID01-9D]MDX5576630.1 hypothetical protein [Streptomyces sp. ID01-9D]
MEDLDLNGLWWIPGNEDDTVAGNLQFKMRDSINLNLNGSFKSFEELNEHKQYDIILGITSNGKKISLINCLESNLRFSFPGYASDSYRARYLFIGVHLNTLEDMAFERYYISFSNLAKWTKSSGFSRREEYYPDDTFKKLDVSYEFPEVKEIAKVNNTKISLHYTFNTKGDFMSNLNLTQKTYIKLDNDSAINFNDFMKIYLYNIQNFLCLAIGTPTFPMEIRASSENFSQEFDGKVFRDQINIYYSNPNIPINLKDKDTHQMVLPYQYIKDDLNIILSNWFDKYELLNPVFDLYFGTMYNSSMYLQHRFSSLIQAIESYHRRVYGGKYLEEGQYEELTNQITLIINENLTGDLKNIFTQKFSHLNELSLRRRLKDIIEINKEIISPFIQLRKGFLNSVTNTRNYLTHFDEGLENSAKKGKELIELCEVLNFLLEICLMTEIGVSKERIIENVSHSQKYNYIKSIKSL